jgi:hypothetical protein
MFLEHFVNAVAPHSLVSAGETWGLSGLRFYGARGGAAS